MAKNAIKDLSNTIGECIWTEKLAERLDKKRKGNNIS